MGNEVSFDNESKNYARRKAYHVQAVKPAQPSQPTYSTQQITQQTTPRKTPRKTPRSTYTTPDTTPDIRPIDFSEPPPLLRLTQPVNIDTVDSKQIPVAYQIASAMSRPMIVSIEGNIGSGKSTLIRLLQTDKVFHAVQRRLQRPVVFVPEPVHVWDTIRDPSSDETIIQKFYQDPSKYAFTFQIMAYATRFKAIQDTLEANPHALIITERCLETDKHVFAKMLYESGKIDEMHYDIYNHCYEAFSSVDVNQFVYVNTNPTICFERIQKRHREGEVNGGIDLNYLTSCDQTHQKWLNTKENVSIVNGNQEFETDKEYYRSILKSLMKEWNPMVSSESIDELWKQEEDISVMTEFTPTQVANMTVHSC